MHAQLLPNCYNLLHYTLNNWQKCMHVRARPELNFMP